MKLLAAALLFALLGLAAATDVRPCPKCKYCWSDRCMQPFWQPATCPVPLSTCHLQPSHAHSAPMRWPSRTVRRTSAYWNATRRPASWWRSSRNVISTNWHQIYRVSYWMCRCHSPATTGPARVRISTMRPERIRSAVRWRRAKRIRTRTASRFFQSIQLSVWRYTGDWVTSRAMPPASRYPPRSRLNSALFA